jgi:hypothetical protein
MNALGLRRVWGLRYREPRLRKIWERAGAAEVVKVVKIGVDLVSNVRVGSVWSRLPAPGFGRSPGTPSTRLVLSTVGQSDQ